MGSLMRSVLAVLMILILATPTLAAEETKTLDEVQALKIKVLILERELIQERLSRVQLQAQGQFQQKGKELDRAIEAAAKEADIDLKEGWQPDMESRTWKKGK